MTTKLFLCGILCLNSHFGCHYRSGSMEEQVGSPCPVAPHESNCCCISQDQYSQLEERLNQMQEDIRTTNRMLHELSSLVHQQLQTAVTNERNRRLSHSGISPNNAMFAEGAPRVSLAGLNAFALVASDALEIMDITDADLKTTDLRSASPAQRPLPNSSGKKLSIPLAVPDPTLSAQWLSKIEIAEVDKVAKPPGMLAKLWSPLQSGLNGLTKIIPVNITKILPLHKDTETPSHDDETLVRRFSVSAINLVKAQSIALRQSKNNPSEQEREDLMVSPQDIISARKLEGEMSRFTLRHDSPYRTAWDLGVIALVLLDLVVTPLSLGFNYQSAFLDFYDTAESVVFVVDFLIRMFSSYIDEHGNLVSGPKQTIAYYVTSGWALPDLLSWFPFELFSGSSHSNVIGFFKFLRLAKVSHLAHRLNSAKKAGIVRFLLLLGIVFTISHLLTCYWSWVAVGWRAHIHEGTFVPKSLFDEYSLCWSLVIGSVNASPPIMYTTAELISVACFMLVGNVLQASVFGAVAALIASIDENEAAYSKKIITVLERCRFLGIPDGLTKRIRGYYENLWRETKSVSSDADLFIEELSPALVCEVKFQLYRDMLKQIPFLSSKTLAPAVIEVLVLHLRTIIYMQDDVLIRKGEFGDWMGFIGSKGSVGILDPNSEMTIVIQILRKGDYFGEMALLQRTKRAATAVALTWVQIHVLYRQDLDYVKELYPTQTEILENEISKYKHMQKSGPQS